jgi:site-specific DNA recombinase
VAGADSTANWPSAENAKNVTRAMRENAQQGFWNGSTPPLGYKVVAAERRGTKIKKVLAIDEVEADLVRCRQGHRRRKAGGCCG